MSIQIAVPSYGRPYWKSLDFLDACDFPRKRIWLFLDTEKEKRRYESRAKGCQIIVTGVEGIVETRNKMFQAMEGSKCVHLDDDILGFWEYKGMEKVERNFYKTIVRLFWECENDHNARVFGFCPYANSRFALGKPEVQYNKYLGRCAFGVDKYRVRFRAPYAEDQEIALSAIADRIGVVRYNRYVIIGDHWVKGGCERINHLEGLNRIEVYRDMGLYWQKRGVNLWDYGYRKLTDAINHPEKWKNYRTPEKIK